MITAGVTEDIGATLKLVLSLGDSSYDELREEFLAMTARAQQDSGLTTAEIVRRGKGVFGRSTAYNYAGDPKYTSFPQPKLLTKYLEICGFTPEQVVFAVARCELIRILYPEGNKSPSILQIPKPQDTYSGMISGEPICTASEGTSPRPDTVAPVSPEPAGWSSKLRSGLAGVRSLLKGVSSYHLPDVDTAQVTAALAPPAVHGPPAPASEPPRRGRSAGPRVESPGQIAVRVVTEMLADKALGPYPGPELVREVYRRASAGMLELPDNPDELAKIGMPVPVDLLAPGDIVQLDSSDGGVFTREPEWGLFIGNGELIWVVSPVGVQPFRASVTDVRVLVARRPEWPSAPWPTSEAASSVLPIEPLGVGSGDSTDPAPATSIAERYELAMREVTERIQGLCAGIEPGWMALRKIEHWNFPFVGGQEAFVRKVFEKTSFPLQADVSFDLPVMMVELTHLAVRPGDIVLTEHGYLGILTENYRLIHLDKRGWPRNIGLGDRLFVAAWRASPAPRRGRSLESAVHPVQAGGEGRRKWVGAQQAQARRDGHPPLASVVAMVCEVVETVIRRGVQVPIDGRMFFEAAVEHGVAFAPETKAWAPVRRRAQSVTNVPVDEPEAENIAPAGTEHAVMAPTELAEMHVVGWVSHWYKAIGDEVGIGDALVQITNPMVEFELDVRARSAGIVTEIAVQSGGTIEAGQRLGTVSAMTHPAAGPVRRRPTDPNLFSRKNFQTNSDTPLE